MAAKDALNQQQFGEATAAISRLVTEDPETNWRVSPPQPGAHVEPITTSAGEKMGYAAYKHEQGKSTADENVEIGGVVSLNNPGHRGIARRAMRKADELYPTAHQHLDAFEGRLPNIYAKYGFRETHRIPFDEKYAPPGWKPEFGKPDVVFMGRSPAQPALFDMDREQPHHRARQMQRELSMKTGSGTGEQGTLF